MNPEENVEAILLRLWRLLPELRERYGVDTLEVVGEATKRVPASVRGVLLRLRRPS